MYQVNLLDHDGMVVGQSECETLKEAKAKARYMLSDEYAIQSESTHEQTQKVEVQNQAGECVFDLFR